MPETYDVAILGGGNAGYAAALRAAQLGLSVALVENQKVGGTCLHRGCIPTKALLHSAEVTETIRHAGDFGVIAEEPSIDWAKVLAYKDSVVSKLHKGLEHVIKQRKVTLVNGKGRLADKSTIELEDATLVKANAVVLATGSYARSLPFIEIDGKAFITSDHALELDAAPSSFIAIGSGAVGMEFASAFRTFGAEVTVIEALPRVAPGEDEEVSKELARQF
ncbi:MAG TPA: FAD-dependent oxidoreductase, partial [Actinomycetota bacterium]|nr:FAD-dependent oxidoreductase [Actinomycetota bacterium]